MDDNDDVGRLDPTAVDPGTTIDTYPGGPNVVDPAWVTRGADGHIWFSNNGINRIGKVETRDCNVDPLPHGYDDVPNDAFYADGLDWEMTTIGAPEHDLGWWWGLEAMQDELTGGRNPAFPSLAEVRRRYEAAVGRELQDLDWYETFALFRSAAILTRIGVLQQRAGVASRLPLEDNPVLDHLTRRVAGLG
jgi:hypothetical protein